MAWQNTVDSRLAKFLSAVLDFQPPPAEASEGKEGLDQDGDAGIAAARRAEAAFSAAFGQLFYARPAVATAEEVAAAGVAAAVVRGEAVGAPAATSAKPLSGAMVCQLLNVPLLPGGANLPVTWRE